MGCFCISKSLPAFCDPGRLMDSLRCPLMPCLSGRASRRKGRSGSAYSSRRRDVHGWACGKIPHFPLKQVHVYFGGNHIGAFASRTGGANFNRKGFALQGQFFPANPVATLSRLSFRSDMIQSRQCRAFQMSVVGHGKWSSEQEQMKQIVARLWAPIIRPSRWRDGWRARR